MSYSHSLDYNFVFLIENFKRVAVPGNRTGDLINTATIIEPADVNDENQTNNSSIDTNNQNSQADLALTKIDNPDPVIAGEDTT